MDKSRRGFTLIEMLVVVAIISIVATSVIGAIRGAIRQARATQCLANMKNLHNAVMAYVADNEHYPYATSWEWYWKHVESKGADPTKDFQPRKGWVAWVRKDGSHDTNPWATDKHNPHGSEYYYPKNTDVDMRVAITNGALFKYVGKDMSTYICPSHRADKKGKEIFLSYSMNSFFRWGNEWDSAGVRPTIIVSDTGPERWISEGNKTAGVDSSRMVLFIELNEEGAEGDKWASNRDGIDADAYDYAHYDKNGKSYYGIRIPNFYSDDCVWDWTDDYRGWDGKCHETGRFNHRKGGDYCHVVYLDGHVGSIRATDDLEATFDDLHNPKKKNDVSAP